MARLPEKNVLSGSKNPTTTTGEMKDALGKLRDYLNDLLGDDSTDKEAARLALGIDLTELASRIEAKADQAIINASIRDKADKTELETLREDMSKKGVPIGTVEYFALAMSPPGYLIANGAAVGREAYPDLFKAIGTRFGEGDGETTFNLPDLIGRFAQGSLSPGQEIEGGLPDATGSFVGFAARKSGSDEPGMDGMFYSSHSNNIIADPAAGTGWFMNCSIETALSRSNPVYGASDTVQPPALTLLPCIKAFDAADNSGLVDMTGLANDVADLSANKLDKASGGKTVKYVVETFSDSTSWWRKWSDGWVEQGGILPTGQTELYTLTFIIPFADNTYTATKNLGWDATNAVSACHGTFFNFQPTSVQTRSYASATDVRWYACGQGA